MSLNHLVMDNSNPLNLEVNDLKVDGTLTFNQPQDIEVNNITVDGTFTFDGNPQYSTPGVSITNYSTLPTPFFDMVTGGAPTAIFDQKFGNLKRYRRGNPLDGQYCIFDCTFQYSAPGATFSRAKLDLTNSYTVDLDRHNETYKLIANVQTLSGGQAAVVQDANTIYVEFTPNVFLQIYQCHFEWFSTVPYDF